MSIRRRILLLLTLALAFPGITGRAQAPQTAPAKAAPVVQAVQSPSERQFRAWLSAFNTGDRAAYEAFLREQFPSRAARLDGDMDFRLRTGGFDVRKVKIATDTTAACLVQERAWEQFARAVVEVEAAPPHRIVRLGLNLVPRRPTSLFSALAKPNWASRVRTKIYAAAAREAFSGAVLVAKDGKVVFARPTGWRIASEESPNTLETRFRIGSMNKMFTASAALQLVADREAHARRTVGKYLPTIRTKTSPRR